MSRREVRGNYPHFLTIPTRWMDNDMYGHVNNVVYYSYFDTVVNEYLIARGVLDLNAPKMIGVVAETMCRFHASVSFPDLLDVALRVGKIGNSSVRYEIGIFRRGEDEICADGYFVHVYVDWHSRTPMTIPDAMRLALEAIVVTEAPLTLPPDKNT